MTTHAFQTEVTRLLHLMVHSLYKDREVFLRELISNASDACDKLRFQALTDPKLIAGDDQLGVTVRADKDAKTLTIEDNGIGLTEAEAIDHLGTIARSGTKAFLEQLQAGGAKPDVNLIGQFGVGFYAAFMVADRVVVESRSARAGAADAVRWESRGDGAFTTERIERPRRGTTITLHLKDDAAEFSEHWRVNALIRRYSDYLAFPVRMPKPDKDGKPGDELEQVNTGQALWTRPKDQITDEQYADFYKSACRAWDAPATRIHATVEGTLAFTTLLFVPGEQPMDLFDRDQRGLSLYVRRVFIMDGCRDLLPEWLRFIRGVVDSDDLPLNVSREMLQQQDTTRKLRTQLTKRVVDHLLKLAQSTEKADQETYAKIDAAFGTVLREGIVSDYEYRDRLARLVRWASSWTLGTPTDGETRPAKTGLEDYVRRAGDGKDILCLYAPTLEAARRSPLAEGAIAKGQEVLFCTDPVDEWVLRHLETFDGRKIVDLARQGESAEAKAKLEEESKAFGDFLGFCKERLGGAEVRLTAKLTDSPCCVVSDADGMSEHMAEMLKRMGREAPKPKRVLELNPQHPLVQRLRAQHADGQGDAIADHLRTLHDQAAVAAGLSIDDAPGFAQRVRSLLDAAVGGRG